MKNTSEISCIASNRHPKRSISSRVRHVRNAPAYSRSDDQYGTIVHAQSGTCHSQSKMIDGTPGSRDAANAFA